MTLIAWMLMILFTLPSLAQDGEISPQLSSVGETQLFSKAAELFSAGNYRTAVEELNTIEQRTRNRAQLGLIAYWKGIIYNRLQEFPLALKSFEQALSLDYAPQDIHYEYGQTLFASERYNDARLQFRESIKKKFKRGVSLYYIAYLSKELGDNKKAVTFYKAIDKLGEEGREVRQAAQVQIGDIYLSQVEKSRDAFRSVERYVIPQYQFALSLNENSPIAPTIREKILELQQRYDLILFKLRNGRPVQNPPYFFRASTEVGRDSNVTFAPTETTIAVADQASLYARADFLGRYTFYYQNYFSFSPEFRANRTHYFNRVPEVFRNDNFLLAPSVRMAYEHMLWDKPATHLFDYEYTEARRDVNANKELEFSSRSHAIMLGERMYLFDMGESIVRLKHRVFESFDSSADAQTTSVVFEQIAGLGAHTLLFYLSYDRTRVDNPIYDTNSYTFRTDIIIPRLGNLFTPTMGIGFTNVDPINDKEARGSELLINPNVRISRAFGRRWRGNLKYDYQNYHSEDESRFAYKKSIYSFELEYLF